MLVENILIKRIKNGFVTINLILNSLCWYSFYELDEIIFSEKDFLDRNLIEDLEADLRSSYNYLVEDREITLTNEGTEDSELNGFIVYKVKLK